MNTFMDLTKQEFDGFKVVEYVGRVKNNNTWKCICSCGNQFISNTGNIRSGHTTSCGCVRDKKTSERFKKHGYAGKGKDGRKRTEYVIWRAIKYRCLVPTCNNYQQYGGRGITICDRWKDSFENFLADMGHRPSKNHSIDRIDNDKGYAPDNCRWATSKEQAYNRRTNVLMTIDSETKTVTEWSTTFNIPTYALERIYYDLNLRTSEEIKKVNVRKAKVKPKKRAFRVKVGDVIFDDAREAADYFGVDQSNICRWVKSGRAEYLPREELNLV